MATPPVIGNTYTTTQIYGVNEVIVTFSWVCDDNTHTDGDGVDGDVIALHVEADANNAASWYAIFPRGKNGSRTIEIVPGFVDDLQTNRIRQLGLDRYSNCIGLILTKTP